MTRIVALHGFLGTPRDWEFLTNALPQLDLCTLSLFDEHLFHPEKGLWEAGKAVNTQLSLPKKDNILIGYSLGGRIALHALLDNPSLWKAAVIISAHPGLESPKLKRKRLQSDFTWAEKFRETPWDQVMGEWNSQTVFQCRPLHRNESDFSRKSLANVLTGWSLGEQDCLLSAIPKLPMPILWLTGEEDKKFTSIANDVQLSHRNSSRSIIQEASHRVPWEQPELFINELGSFIRTINKKEVPCLQR